MLALLIFEDGSSAFCRGGDVLRLSLGTFVLPALVCEMEPALRLLNYFRGGKLVLFWRLVVFSAELCAT